LQFTAEIGKCSNNIAEYKAAMLGLRKLQAMGVQYCILKTDSKGIASQIEKECMARDETLERYLATVRRMDNLFKGFRVKHIERTQKQMSWQKLQLRKRWYLRMYFLKLSKTPS
jgi:ribonuclease HI